MRGRPARAHDLRDVRAACSTRTVEDDTGAPFFNATTTWRNSEIVGFYDAEAIRALKDTVDGDLYVSGSATLVRAMLADDALVDELHLFVYALTLGAGQRLLRPQDAPLKLALAACDTYDNGVVRFAYGPQ